MSDSTIRRSEMVSKESFDLIVAAQRRLSQEAGYNQAIADVLAAAVFIAEDVLRAAPADADHRAVLYRFVAGLETQTRRLAHGDDVMGDGAGI